MAGAGAAEHNVWRMIRVPGRCCCYSFCDCFWRSEVGGKVVEKLFGRVDSRSLDFFHGGFEFRDCSRHNDDIGALSSKEFAEFETHAFGATSYEDSLQWGIS